MFALNARHVCNASSRPGSGIIVLSNGHCEAEIYCWGCMLNAFSIQVDGRYVNVIDGFSSVEDARQNILPFYKSAKLSPFACNMNHGRYRFHDTSYQIKSHLAGSHAKHGLVYDALFTLTGTHSSETFASAEFTYDYEGSDEGYPFPYTITVTYVLSTENSLRVTTKINNRHGASIPVADGWHPYIHLGTSLDGHTLQINSTERMDYDAELLPLPNLVQDTRFLHPHLLEGIDLDNGFILRNTHPACVLANPYLSLTVDAVKNYSFLQLYIPPSRNSIAIEVLSGPPDNFNNKTGLTELGAGENIEFEVAYTLHRLR